MRIISASFAFSLLLVNVSCQRLRTQPVKQPQEITPEQQQEPALMPREQRPDPPSPSVATTPQQQTGPQQGSGEPVVITGDDKESLRFLNPRIKGLPVDYCMEYHGKGDNRRGIGCGQEAANLFCREQGLKDCAFYEATYYSHNATFTLGNGEINPEDIGGGLGRHTFFTNITCSAVDSIIEDPMKGGDPASSSSSVPSTSTIAAASTLPEGGGAAASAADEAHHYHLNTQGSVGPSGWDDRV